MNLRKTCEIGQKRYIFGLFIFQLSGDGQKMLEIRVKTVWDWAIELAIKKKCARLDQKMCEFGQFIFHFKKVRDWAKKKCEIR